MESGVPISKRLVLINSASSLATRFVNVAVLVWLQQYLLRRISPEEYALYPVLLSVMTVLPLVSFALTSGLRRYVVEAYAVGDEERVTQIVSTMLPVLAGTAAVILAAGWVFSWHVDRVLTITPQRLWDARIMMALMVFGFAMGLALSPFEVGLYVRQRFVLANLIMIGGELVRIALLFALLFGVSARVLWVVVASVSARLSALLITQAISRRLVPALRFRRNALRWATVKELTRFSAWSFVSQIAGAIRTGSGPIILNKLATATDVTCLYLGAMFQRQIQQAVQPIWTPLEPALTAMHATGDRARLARTYLRGGRYALWAALFLAVPLIVYRRELMLLYVGSRYLQAATVMGLLLLGFPLTYGNVMLLRLAYATAQPGPVARRQIALQLVSLGLALYFVGVRGMGAVGCALAALLAAAILQPALMWPLGLRMAGVPFTTWARQTLGPGLLPAVAGLGVWIALERLIQPTGWVPLGVCAGLGATCYVVVLFSLALKPYERDELRQALGLVRSRLGALLGGRDRQAR